MSTGMWYRVMNMEELAPRFGVLKLLLMALLAVQREFEVRKTPNTMHVVHTEDGAMPSLF